MKREIQFIKEAIKPLIASTKLMNDQLNVVMNTLDSANIRLLLNLNDTKIEYESQFNGDCVLYNEDIKVAYSFVEIPADEIFQDGFSVEGHGWDVLCEDDYRWFIKANPGKGEEIDFSEFKESLK